MFLRESDFCEFMQNSGKSRYFLSAKLSPLKVWYYNLHGRFQMTALASSRYFYRLFNDRPQHVYCLFQGMKLVLHVSRKFYKQLSRCSFFVERDIVGVNVLQHTKFEYILLLGELTLLYSSYSFKAFCLL